jgi:hypothetical protein
VVKQGWTVAKKTVLKLMRAHGLVCKVRRRKRCNSHKGEQGTVAPNMLNLFTENAPLLDAEGANSPAQGKAARHTTVWLMVAHHSAATTSEGGVVVVAKNARRALSGLRPQTVVTSCRRLEAW